MNIIGIGIAFGLYFAGLVYVDELKRMLYEKAKQVHMQRFPYNDFLYQTYDDLDG